MEYKGIKLTEFKPTENVIFDPPKRMLVWDDSSGWVKANVIAVFPNRSYPVIASSQTWRHCAEPPKEEPKLATNHELARWLMEGNGEIAYANGKNIVNDNDYAYGYWSYIVAKANSPVKDVVVRKWDDTEWHEPTREYLGLEDK